ncbi:hypothetical protein GCM10009847_10610 [Leucobacter tardus]|uniref:Uncharacterized protein n=1 Tax=Leucobacter tardus TaxID=501483 RepID=A0A939QFL1_9MICO|nr:hypothetical protein [Leucobacter tardus]MBO2989258.1 hypothetical protein [Leucobacter tardus]
MHDPIEEQRAMMEEHAENGWELPATSEQLHYLADLMSLNHAAAWQGFGDLNRGAVSQMISSVLIAHNARDAA